MANGRLFILIGAIVGGIGVLCLGIAGVIGLSTAGFLSSAEQTTGTVVDFNERMSTRTTSSGTRRTTTVWYPVVSFTDAAGKTVEFEDSTGASPAGYEIGETVSVAYDSADPGNARIASFGSTYQIPLITGLVGLGVTTLGGVIFAIGSRRRRLAAWLRRNGTEVWAKVASIGQDPQVTINRRHPYVVTATWNDPRTGQAYTATSDYLREDPGPMLSGQPYVRVLFDPEAPERNLLDLETRAVR